MRRICSNNQRDWQAEMCKKSYLPGPAWGRKQECRGIVLAQGAVDRVSSVHLLSLPGRADTRSSVLCRRRYKRQGSPLLFRDHTC